MKPLLSILLLSLSISLSRAEVPCSEEFDRLNSSHLLFEQLVSSAKETCNLSGDKSGICKETVKKGYEAHHRFEQIGAELEKRCIKHLSPQIFFKWGEKMGKYKVNFHQLDIQHYLWRGCKKRESLKNDNGDIIEIKCIL